FYDRNACPTSLSLDFFSKQVSAFGENLRSFHGCEVKCQSHCVMRGVGQYDSRLLDVGLHLATSHLSLQPSDPVARLRAAFHVLEFLLLFFAAHHESRLAAPPLDHVVDEGPSKQKPCRGSQQAVYI